MRRDLDDQRDVFFIYLAVISYANSTYKVKKGEDVDDSCPRKFLSQSELRPIVMRCKFTTNLVFLYLLTT